MNNKLFLIVLLICNGGLFAQISINTDGSAPPPSAGLEVNFSNIGLLIPRIALVKTALATPITSPALSLLVYNTTTANDVSPGFYYWNGSSWVRMSGGGPVNYVTKWAASNTIGNSSIYDDGTNVGIGTTNPTAKLDVAGRISQTSTGDGNTAAGYQALYTNTTGANNNAMGYMALYANTTGPYVQHHRISKHSLWVPCALLEHDRQL